MTARFENSSVANVGISYSTVFTSPPGEKSILIGCNISNITGAILPINIILQANNGNSNTFITKNFRINNGENYEIMKGNKLVLQSGDKILANSTSNSSFDVIASLLVGVN